MSIVFMVGKRERLLTTIGIPYGFLFAEDCNPVVVYTQKHGEDVLQKAVESKLITTEEEATEIGRQMKEAGLAADDDALFARILEFRVPEDFVPTLRFQLCSKQKCFPLPHGNIVEIEGERPVHSITSNINGFLVCSALTHGEKAVHPLDAINCLQQILVANLAKDENEREAQFDALPEEVKRHLTLTALMANLSSPQGGSEIVMLGIPLPGLHI